MARTARIDEGTEHMGSRAPWRRAVRITGVGLLTAVPAGCLAGGTARLLMRLAALAEGATPHFSWSGTLGVVVIFIVADLPGALTAAATSGRSRWGVLIVGAALLCIPATGIASTEVSNTSGGSPAQQIAVDAATAGIYGCIASLPVLTIRLADSWRRHRKGVRNRI